MAVNNVHQREIIEVPFTLPDGQILPHPALVLSCDELQDIEPGMFYAVLISSKNHFPQLTIHIQNEWLSSPLTKKSYFVTHIIGMFNVDEVISHHNCFIRQPFFDKVIDQIIRNVVDADWED
jgi:hypothetical protein